MRTPHLALHGDQLDSGGSVEHPVDSFDHALDVWSRLQPLCAGRRWSWSVVLV